mmetsp:Transcript_24438/g.55768  ORF Transcript_24438/g.55768 Transcript_24438/m.55768 type:complete len:497 (-) Transcript_24438:358-1848(-)
MTVACVAVGGGGGEKGKSSSTGIILTREGATVAVCRALNLEFVVDADMNSAIANGTLDAGLSDICGSTTKQSRAMVVAANSELRVVERCLLGTLLSRNVTTSESFTNAYVQNMVRNGEAMEGGHERMCESVQTYKVGNSHRHSSSPQLQPKSTEGSNLAMECGISTLLPYDVIVDDQGWWQDPGRFEGGFTPGLTAQDLLRRAHTRAQVQRALFKMQEKYGMKGGVKSPGLYGEPSSSSTSHHAPTSPHVFSSHKKRKLSAIQISTSEHVPNDPFFHPPHYSAPLVVDLEDIENTPYGRYESGGRRGSGVGKMGSGSGGKRVRALSSSANSSPKNTDCGNNGSHGLTCVAGVASAAVASLVTPIKDGEAAGAPSSSPPSFVHTKPIDWRDVVDQFQPVSLLGDASSSTTQPMSHVDNGRPDDKGEQVIHIFAPVVRKLDIFSSEKKECEEEIGIDDEEEEISDEAILFRHQEVLDRMKEKMEAVNTATGGVAGRVH